MEDQIGDRIRLVFELFKYDSQAQFARDCGIATNTLSTAINNKKIPGIDFFQSILKTFTTLNARKANNRTFFMFVICWLIHANYKHVFKYE